MSKIISNDIIYMPHLGEDDSKLKGKDIVHDTMKPYDSSDDSSDEEEISRKIKESIKRREGKEPTETRKERKERLLMEKEEREAMKEQRELEEQEKRNEQIEKDKHFEAVISRIAAAKAAGTFKKRAPRN